MPLADTLGRPRPAVGDRPLDRARAWGGRWGPALATAGLPFVLVVYLALKGGGYDTVVRGEVGLAVWWVVLLGAIIGALPRARITHAGWIAVAALGAFALWTGLAVFWTESSERSIIELSRVATYLAVLVLALAIQGREGLRRTIAGIGMGLSLIGLLALLSRLQPSWFPPNETASVLEIARARLNYPLEYWNGLAASMAIATPLVLVIAIEARRVLVQALTTAIVPVLALTCFYTLSRGGVLEMAVAVAAFFALYPRRLAAAATVFPALLGSGLLIAAATQRDALLDGLSTPAALEQGDEMLAIVVMVCAGVGLLRAAVGLAARHGLLARAEPRRGVAVTVGATLLAGLLAAGIASGAVGGLDERWEEFKAPAGPAAGDTSGRFESASGNGRYQWWQGAVEANSTDPLLGIGPGTYEFYWAREGTLPGFIRDAHSFYFETLAELGIIGLALVLGSMVALLGFGARRALRSSPPARPWLAAATAACATFATAAAVDWVWELAVLPAAFLCIAAAILAHREGRVALSGAGGRERAGIGLLAVVGAVAIAVPLIGAKFVEASRDDVDAQQLAPALESAREADEVQPWAATPPLQQALILELQGDYDSAAAAALEATREEPTNWRTWFVLSRLEDQRGNEEASSAAHRKARALNPRSALFAR